MWANLAPKSSQNREEERLRSTLEKHLEKGSQNDEKKSFPKMKNRRFFMVLVLFGFFLAPRWAASGHLGCILGVLDPMTESARWL